MPELATPPRSAARVHHLTPPRFSRARARAWLCGPDVVDPEGHVMSWHNAAHPGYRYPEAAGLVLSLLASENNPGPIAERVATTLLATAQADATGRGGTRYLFDEGVVLAGLQRYVRHAGPDFAAALQPLRARFMARLERRQVTGSPMPARWSSTPGPHLLKLAVAACMAPEISASDRATMIQWLHHASAQTKGPRFVTDAAGQTYVHAHCYAVEGALRLATPQLLPAGPGATARGLAQRGADWLATIQQPDGGFPAWHDGERGWGGSPADVAAQAIRIWTLCDAHGYDSAIARAREFVDTLTAPSGAVYYQRGHADENTWATVFAVQAQQWARAPIQASAACLL